MTTFEDAIGKRVQLTGHFVQPVLVEAAEQFDSLVLLRVRTAEGQLREAMVRPDELRFRPTDGRPHDQGCRPGA